jgi:hypothetical protein
MSVKGERQPDRVCDVYVPPSPLRRLRPPVASLGTQPFLPRPCIHCRCFNFYYAQLKEGNCLAPPPPPEEQEQEQEDEEDEEVVPPMPPADSASDRKKQVRGRRVCWGVDRCRDDLMISLPEAAHASRVEEWSGPWCAPSYNVSQRAGRVPR